MESVGIFLGSWKGHPESVLLEDHAAELLRLFSPVKPAHGNCQLLTKQLLALQPPLTDEAVEAEQQGDEKGEVEAGVDEDEEEVEEEEEAVVEEDDEVEEDEEREEELQVKDEPVSLAEDEDVQDIEGSESSASLQRFASFLFCERYADIWFVLDDGSKMPAHCVILDAGSEYFQLLLKYFRKEEEQHSNTRNLQVRAPFLDFSHVAITGENRGKRRESYPAPKAYARRRLRRIQSEMGKEKV